MVHNPGWRAYRYWQQGNSAYFCVIYFSGWCAWGCVMYTFVAKQHHSHRTIQVFEWLHIRKNKLSFCLNCSVYAQREWLPWLDDFVISLLGSKRSFLNVTLCIVSSKDKCQLAKKCRLNLTFYRMWLKLSTTLKSMPLTHICSHSSMRRWMQSTHVFSYTQKWGGFLKVDHWLEQGCQTLFHRGPHQPCGCLQRAECNFNSWTVKD